VAVGGGGDGGDGGDGGTAWGTFNGEVRPGTKSVTGIGLLVSSDGGDGGAGGTAGRGSVGGAGGTGGNGGSVSGVNKALIITLGELEHGIFGHSDGGDGGREGQGDLPVASSASGAHAVPSSFTYGGKGGTGGRGGTVNLENRGTIRTTGARSNGILAQSVGGRGGGEVEVDLTHSDLATPTSLSPSIGGGGDGNAVTVTNMADASIFTSGRGANGIVAQSVGGGLGTGGGRVTVTNSGTLATSGTNAIGILARSIGGAAARYGRDDNSTLSGIGNFGGDAGDVTVNLLSLLTTKGAGAAGVWAESVGGSDPHAYTGTPPGGAGLNRSGGKVTVSLSNSAVLRTYGTAAPAVFVRSIGGDSGQVTTSNGAFTSSTNGTKSQAVNLEVGTDDSAVVVEAKGAGSAGIHAQVDDGSAINVQIGKAALVVGGRARLSHGTDAAGIFMDGGAGNVVVNAGGITSHAGVYGIALNSNSAESTSLTNTGTITGSQIFPGGGMLANLEGGTLITGRTLQLGPKGTIANSGTIDPGGRGQMLTTVMTGNLDQSKLGRLILDSDHVRGRSDRLEIGGNALLDGVVEMRPLSLIKQPVAVLEADTIKLVSTLATTKTRLFSYVPTIMGGSLVIAPHANLMPVGQNLNSTQADLAASLQQIWDRGDPRYGASFAALSQRDGAQSYAASLDSLAGQAVGGVGVSRWLASHGFIGNLNSCSSFVGDSLLLTEADCGWARMIGGHADRGSSHDTVGFTQRTVTIQAGGQKEVAPSWFLGGSLAYENSRLDGDDDIAKVDGDSALAGFVVKRQAGALLLSTAADVSYGWYQSRRTITLGETKLAAKADPDAQSAGLHARAAYEVPFQRWYLRPTLDLHAAYVRMDGYSESGAEPFNLDVKSSDEAFFAASPILELGTRLDLPEGSTLRAFASAGATFFSDNDWHTKARFADSSTDSFDSELPMPDTVARVGLGIEMVTTKQMTTKLQYGGDFGDNYSSHAGMFRLGVMF
jgi:outer membrane autotransporter protein